MILSPYDDEPNDGYVHTPTGLVLPVAAAAARYAPSPRDDCSAVDLFCGCGGFSCGAIQAGFEIVAAVEWEPASAVTYMANLCRYGKFGLHFVEEADKERLNRYLEKHYRQVGLIDKDGELLPSRGKKITKPAGWMAGSGWIKHQKPSVIGCTNFFFGDITKLTGARILNTIGRNRGDVMAVFGGPPCQGFSTSGKRQIDDPRNNLVFEFVRLVLEIRPKTMVMENVTGIQTMTTADGLPIVDAVCRALEDGDFSSIEMLRKAIALQAGNVGVINRRGRKKTTPQQARKASKQKKLPKPKEPPEPTLAWRDVREAVATEEIA